MLPKRKGLLARIATDVADIKRKTERLMQELLDALAALKADRETFLTAMTAEFTKLEGEIANPEALKAAKDLVAAEDAAIKAVVLPTS